MISQKIFFEYKPRSLLAPVRNIILLTKTKGTPKNKAVVGGQEASIHSIPWQVGIMGNYYNTLSYNLSVTAAQC